MSLPLKINIVKVGQVKTLRFGPTMSVQECCRQIEEKAGAGGPDHGLFQKGIEGKRPARWLRVDRTLQYYDLRANDELEYKKKHRPIRVRLMDDSVKTILVDDSKSVGEIVEVIGKKIGIKNPEEFSLQAESNVGTWLIIPQALHEQGVADDETLILKKRFFVDDANVGRDDPVQLHLLYVQCRDGVIDGTHPCSIEEGIQFAALQCQVQFGNHNPATHKAGFFKVKEFMPAEAAKKEKGVENKIIAEFRKLVGMSEINAKYRYVQLCRSLKTYGITFFEVKHKVSSMKKPQPRLLGVTRESVVIMDANSKKVLFDFTLEQLKRWAASPSSFTLDFGDYEEDYINVLTTEGEAISQLIGGYIDIILKKRRDIGVIVDDDDTEIGTVESLGKIKGQVSMSSTTSNIGAHEPQGSREQQLTPQQQALIRKQGTVGAHMINVEDLPSAQKAVQDMLDEMSAKGMPVPGASNNLTPDQWKHQLMTHSKALSSAAGKLVDNLNSPGPLDRNQMNNHAREIAMACGNMVSSARNASAGQPDEDMPLFDGAQAVAEAIKDLLQASKDLAGDPNDPERKDALHNAVKALEHAGQFLDGAAKDMMTDPGSRKLLMETARQVAQATDNLCEKAENVADNLDPTSRDKVKSAARNVGNAAKAAAGVADALAPVMLDPDALKQLNKEASDLKRATGALLASARAGAADPTDMESLNEAVKKVNDAITQMLNSTETAEPQSRHPKDFANAASNILQGTSKLANSKTPKDTKDTAKDILKNSGRLIDNTKQMSADAEDEATRQKLLACAKNVADATKNLMLDSQSAVGNPQNQKNQEKLKISAKKLADSTKLLMATAAHESAMQSLRSNAKEAAAATTGLVNAAHNASASSNLDGPDKDNLLDAARQASEALKDMLANIGHSVKNPDDLPAQNQLLSSAKKTGPLAFSLVAASKQAVPKIQDPKTKQQLSHASNNAGNAVRNLLEAMKDVSNAKGVAEIDEALEQIDGVNAVLDSALMFAENGNLEGLPGQTRENAMELLNVSVKALAASTKEMALAKNDKEKLGPASRNLADSVSQVTDSAKNVASTSQSRTTQKAVLGAAKHLADQSGALLHTARSISANPGDTNISNQLGGGVKKVADALQNLVSTSKGADPGAREVEEALKILKEESARINTVPLLTGGDFPTFSADLVSAAKALGATVNNLTGVAQSNPAGLASATRSASQTIPPLVNSANAVSGAAPDKQQQTQIISGTKRVTDQMENLLLAAKLAAAQADQEDGPAQDGLKKAAKKMSDAINDLMKTVSNETPAQREMESALLMMKDLSDNLHSASTEKVDPIRGDPFDQLIGSAKSLAESTSALVHATLGETPQEEVAERGATLAANMEDLVKMTKATVVSASSPSGGAGDTHNPFLEYIRPVEQASNKLEGACRGDLTPQKKKQIIEAAREVAGSTSALVGSARQVAQEMKDDDPQTSRVLLKHAQTIANSTSLLVSSAKNSASGVPGSKDQMDESSANLKDAMDGLVDAVTNSNDVGGDSPRKNVYDYKLLNPHQTQLVNSTKGIASSATALIGVSKSVMVGEKSKGAAQPQLASNAKSVTNAISALLAAANLMKPGTKELEKAITTVQQGSNKLQTAALNSAIGQFKQNVPPGKTRQSCQEGMVNTAREIAATVKNFVNAARDDKKQLGKAALGTASLVPKLVDFSLYSASLSSAPGQQQGQLEGARSLTDALLGLMTAAKEGNNKALAANAKATSQAIGSLLEGLKSGVVGLRECDEAIKGIEKASRGLDKNLASVQKQPYGDAQNDLKKSAQDLVKNLDGLVETARKNPQQVGSSSTRVAKVIPILNNCIMVAAASTTDEQVAQNLVESGKKINDATASVISHTKLVGADPKNPGLQNQLVASFRSVSHGIAALMSAADLGDVAERDANEAVQKISNIMSDLDSSSLFAAAGTLRGSSDSSEQELNDRLLKAAKEMAARTNAIVAAAAKSTDNFGTAAQDLAETTGNVASASKEAAANQKDSGRQQGILTGARAVAVNSQQLLSTARTVHKGEKAQANQKELSSNAMNLADSIRELVGLTQDASADLARGLIEMTKARSDIGRYIEEFNEPSFKGNEKSSSEDLIIAAKGVAESTGTMVAACSGSPQELVTAAKESASSIKDLLDNAKPASLQAREADVTAKVQIDSRNTAEATMKFIEAAKKHKDKPSATTQTALSAAAGSVVDRINDVVDAAGELPGGKNAQELFRSSESLEEIAEKELNAAAKVIEDAAAFLLSAKKKKAKKVVPGTTIDDKDITDAILDAARAIAAATGVLVKSATQQQKELVAQGRVNKAMNVYKRDPTWAKGLISAAQSVAGTVDLLVKSANAASQGKADEEELVGSARGVSAATARLVAAARAKGDPLSSTQKKLGDASRAVSKATQQLVDAAKAAGKLEEDEADKKSQDAVNNSVKNQIEQNIEIARLEKQLQQARKKQREMNKAGYL